MKSIRALIVEDSEDDVKIMLRELQKGGYDPIHARVETPESMAAELAERPWDIIFSDFSMPRFNAFDALSQVRQSDLDLPFIIVSGTIGEDRAVTAMKAGAHDYILKGNLKRLVPAVDRELREAKIRKERREAEATIYNMAYIDPITDLPNRTHFLVQTQQILNTPGNKENSLALLLMDLDRFKDVNDTLGHKLGDTLLHQVGMRIRSVLRPSDIIARLGGDEFGILLQGLSTSDDVKSVVRKLQDFFLAPFMIDSVPIAVEASIGVALSTGQTIDANSLLQKADIAMYQAKKMASGFSIYASETDPHSLERLGLMAQLRDAISKNQLVLNFQPQVDIKNGIISGTEALVRWQHPNRGLIPPDNFITTAEHTGLLGPLTNWILTNALNFTRQSNLEGIKLQVSVNISARSLHDPHLPQIIEDALKNTGIEPRQLVIEITESAIVLDPKRAEENLVILSGMGLWLSIDDFGTGYTSLASIARQPINEVKIDKSFVLGMLKNKNDAMIVQTVIELGHNFGLSVVAEGVESREIFDALAYLNCDKAQGYFISKPQAYEPLKNWFLTSPWKLNTEK